MRIRRKWLVWGGIVAAVVLVPVLYSAVPYALATYQYEKLVARKPATKSEVEGLLFFYSAKQIDITNSLWGRGTVLAPGDSCWQYKILWRDPIDIVYDSEGKVKHIFASFE